MLLVVRCTSAMLQLYLCSEILKRGRKQLSTVSIECIKSCFHPPLFNLCHLILFDSVMPYMADRCRIVIEAVLKYAQELLGCNSNTNLSADLKVLPHSHQGHALRLLNWLRKLMGIFEGFCLLLADIIMEVVVSYLIKKLRIVSSNLFFL